MTRAEAVAALDEIGTLLEIKGEDPFRSRAYHNAAAALEQIPGDLTELIASGELAKVRGIGRTMLDTITALVQTGEHPFLTRLQAEVPRGLFDLLRLPGLGSKKVKVLHDELGVTDLASLQEACEQNRVASLKGFGGKTQQKLLEGIAFLGLSSQRVRIDQCEPLADALVTRLSALPGVIRAAVCGSFRRRKETVGDLDLLISAEKSAAIMEAFVRMPEVVQVSGHGETKSSVVLGLRVGARKIHLNCDLRVLPDELFAFALHHCTGSAAHNKHLRALALARGLTLSEYGLQGASGKVQASEEAEIYRALGLAYIPPELREDTGEIEAAANNRVPELLTVQEIRGVFHNHSTYSDGSATLEEMARAAQALGFEYFGVADHSQSLRVARGLLPEAIREQHREIDELNARLTGIRILKGTECDILEDGTLDYDDQTLRSFDYVVISVHSHFNQSQEEMTSRICKALSHPAVTMLGHATGRLLLQREGYKVDLEQVLQTAARHGKMVEINAQPTRLDLDWLHCKRAKDLKVPVVINPDAHSTDELVLYRYGVDVARRGWLSRDDVFNTRDLADIESELRRRRGK